MCGYKTEEKGLALLYSGPPSALYKANFMCTLANKKLASITKMLQPLGVTALGEGMKSLLIKDHVHSSIFFCEQLLTAVSW